MLAKENNDAALNWELFEWGLVYKMTVAIPVGLTHYSFLIEDLWFLFFWALECVIELID